MRNVNLMIPGEIFFQFNFVLLSSRLYNETFSKSAGKITKLQKLKTLLHQCLLVQLNPNFDQKKIYFLRGPVSLALSFTDAI